MNDSLFSFAYRVLRETACNIKIRGRTSLGAARIPERAASFNSSCAPDSVAADEGGGGSAAGFLAVGAVEASASRTTSRTKQRPRSVPGPADPPSRALWGLAGPQGFVAYREQLVEDVDGAVTRQMTALREQGVLQRVEAGDAAAIFHHGMLAAMEIMDAQGAEIPISTTPWDEGTGTSDAQERIGG